MKKQIITRSLVCNEEPCMLVIRLATKGKAHITIKGRDKARNEDVYFLRVKDMDKKGTYTLQINLPISPQTLELYMEMEGGALHINASLTDMLPSQRVEVDEYTAHFIDQAVEFARHANRLETGFTYTDEYNEYPIEYTDQLRDIEGNPMSGPAKVRRMTGYITISAPEFRKFTIFSRVFVLLHEWFHHHANTGDETEVDVRALEVYLSLGFPKLEVMNATAGYFGDSEGLLDRSERLLEYLRAYQENPACNKGRKCA